VFLEEEFEHKLTDLMNFIRIGSNHHAFLDFGAAGGLKVFLSLHSNDAESTALDRSENLVEAKCWNMDVVLPGHLQDGVACFGLKFLPVDG